MEEHNTLDQGQSNYNFNQGQRQLPNEIAVLVLGILSIVACFCFGPLSFILGGIGLYLGNQSKTMYQRNPEQFTRSSYNTLNAGYICSIIGLILGILWGLYMVAVLLFGIGSEFNWWSNY